jgi:hypothetical protein
MKTFVAFALLLGMFQQTFADAPPAPKYIPPVPKPIVGPFQPTPIFNIQRLISPAPDPDFFVVPLSEHINSAQPWPVFHAAQPPKRIEEATRADLKNENRPGLTSFIHHVKHVPVKDLARSLGRKFAMNHVINAGYQKYTTNAPLVIIPEKETGHLLITTFTWNVDEIKRLISEIDREPKTFQIKATIKAIDADGKQIVARPNIKAFENQLTTVQINNTGGTSIEIQLNVRELTLPQPTAPSVKKASAEKSYPHPMPAVSASAYYRGITWEPEVIHALSASYQPIHVTHRKKEPPRQIEREKEIQQALEKQISLHFEDARLIDVIKHIASSSNISFVLDHMGLEEEGLTSDTIVSIDLDGIRLKSALSNLLKPRRLDYIIEDEVLKITSKNRAQGPMNTVTYPVGNLLAAPSTDHAAISSETLISLITSFVEPDSWSERGGRGVIANYEKTHSLVVRQTDQGHEKIKKLLETLRDVKQDNSE